MDTHAHVARPPTKPLLIYDGDCRFCRLWISRWKQSTGERVDYVPFQDAQIVSEFPELAREQLEAALHLVEADGRVYRGAEAALRALAHEPRKQWLLKAYQKSPALARWCERGYGFIAGQRRFFSSLTQLGWGEHVKRPDYFLGRWVFLRALGMVYLIAFVSLWVQIEGLIGSNGILPTDQFMQAVEERVAEQNVGADRYRVLPTLCWLSGSDGFLHFQCAAGTVLALLLIVGVAPAPCLALLWVLYLSLTTVSRVFLSFQWDNLLLETGFLAILLAPLQMLPGVRREAPPSRLALWLLRWLLFRLMFESGWVKLLSGDPTWRNLTALAVHYETQPLPTWIGWYAHQLPLWFQQASALGMFCVELVVPFLIFAPRRPRFVAAWATIALQVAILLTGNYTFFNLITIALCLLLFDDSALRKCVPAKWRERLLTRHRSPVTPLRWPLPITAPLAAIVLFVSTIQLLAMFGAHRVLPGPLLSAHLWFSPFRTINSYGLFAVMTTSRPEIIVEGSDDGQTWRAYEFKHKPGDVKRRPRFVAPHQPRLDWQMWFAALGTYRQNPWFISFCLGLLEGSPEVLALLKHNPFPDVPPRYIRARVYEYRFTDLAGRRETGAWWRREFKGQYCPVLSSRERQKQDRRRPVLQVLEDRSKRRVW